MGRVYTLEELSEQRSVWKKERRSVVFTNGVFDILHRGHAEYLAAAKRLGDILVVAVNSDSSVRRIKGHLRPIVSQDDRAFLLSQLASVDAVCLFDQDTPLEIISRLVPDVLVKGADWGVHEIVGKDVVERAGGSVRTIALVPNHSTTDIIEQIRVRFGVEKR